MEVSIYAFIFTGIKEATGILVDSPDPTGRGGNTTKGDTSLRLMDPHQHQHQHQSVLVDLVPVRYRSALRELITGMYGCLKVYNSDRCVDVPAYREH